jgi:hypothetical protein
VPWPYLFVFQQAGVRQLPNGRKDRVIGIKGTVIALSARIVVSAATVTNPLITRRQRFGYECCPGLHGVAAVQRWEAKTVVGV